jgi:expansin
MKTTARATRHRKVRQWSILSVVAAVAAGTLVGYVISMHPSGHQAAAGYAATTPSVSAPAGTTPGVASATMAAAQRSVAAKAQPSAADTPHTTSGTAPLAGRIKPGIMYQGVATEYSAGNGDGACLFGPADGMMIAAMNYTDYESAKACGAYILVHTASGASITVLITNECPLPCAPGQLDLSRQAFAALADPSLGRISITWSLLSPDISDTISLRYKTGSSPYWCGIQVIGHRNPVATLEVRTGSGWRQLPRTDYNYFLSADGAGCGGAIRITDIYGERLTVDGVSLAPDVVQPTDVQFARH